MSLVGGRIPFIENDKGEIEGVEAGIDKNVASALFASSIDANVFIISCAGLCWLLQSSALDWRSKTIFYVTRVDNS